MLKRKARRIRAAMAADAAFVVHVIEQTLAHRAFGAVLDFGEIHIRGRFRRWLAQEDFEYLDAALGGRGDSRVREEREKADLRQNARPSRRLRERVCSPFVVGGERDAVKSGTRVVDRRIV